ncbi:unnamed protein product [Jaminaea pallidilutea]
MLASRSTSLLGSQLTRSAVKPASLARSVVVAQQQQQSVRLASSKVNNSASAPRHYSAPAAAVSWSPSWSSASSSSSGSSNSSSSGSSTASSSKSGFGRKAGIAALVAVPLVSVPVFLSGDDGEAEGTPSSLTRLTNAELARSYAVYSVCSLPWLIDIAPALLAWSSTTMIPGVKALTEFFVRITFFDHFCGGAESAEDAKLIISKLAEQRVGAMLTYSVEAESGSAKSAAAANAAGESLLHTELIKEVLNSVDFAADMNEKQHVGSSVAIKVSGLLKDPSTLARVSAAIVPRQGFNTESGKAVTSFDHAIAQRKIHGISEADSAAMLELLQALQQAGKRAQQGKVKMVVDAEQSWLNPAIDLLCVELAREFNQLPSKRFAEQDQTLQATPTFYFTLQTSLRRSEQFLKEMLEDARNYGYSLGVKAVRGAYVDAEHKDAAKLSMQSPAWNSKDETDACFNGCASQLVTEIAAEAGQSIKQGQSTSVGAFFATHNHASVDKLLSLMVETNLATQLQIGAATITQEASPIPLTMGNEQDATSAAVQPSHPPHSTKILLSPAAQERIAFGQLLGMADDITDHLATHLRGTEPSSINGVSDPCVYKYLPYGPLEKVMPYLVRRGKENKSVMAGNGQNGGAVKEKRRIEAETRRRVKAWWRGEPAVPGAAVAAAP